MSNLDFTEMRKNLISELRKKGINDNRILQAIMNVPRERFINNNLQERAYEDNALPILCNQSISQPYTVAFMTMLLDVIPGMKVLEIGTGSGYQAAILAELGAVVFSVEIVKELFDYSISKLNELGYKIMQYYSDGTMGWKEFAPYDRIIVTAGSPQIPIELINQLVIGGKLVIPIGDKNIQTMNLIEKYSENEYSKTYHDNFRFVPLTGKEGWQN